MASLFLPLGRFYAAKNFIIEVYIAYQKSFDF